MEPPGNGHVTPPKTALPYDAVLPVVVGDLEQQRLSAGQQAQVVMQEIVDSMGANLTAKPQTAQQQEQGNKEGQEQWVYYPPFLSVKTLIVFFSALCLIWSFAWLYVGATWDPASRLQNLRSAVLNCDQGASQALVAAMPPSLQSYTSHFTTTPLATQLLAGSLWNPSSPASQALLWQNFTCSTGCSSNPVLEAQCQQELKDKVSDGTYWLGWFFSSNTTLEHLSDFNLTGSNASVLITPANQQLYVNAIISRGRNYSTYSYIILIMQVVINAISNSFGVSLATSSLAASGALNLTALVTPLQMNVVDLHPVSFFGQNLASYVLTLLMWLGGAFAVSLSYQYKMDAEVVALNALTPDKRPPLVKLILAITVKAICCMLFTLILAVLLVCVVLALANGDDVFDRSAGYAIAFLWYLSWSYISINAVLLHAMGIERFNSMSAFLLILQLMSSGGIISEELSPRFFFIGKGFPFYYSVRTLRTVFFGGEETALYINWLVVTAYNVVFGPLSMWFVAHNAWKAGEKARPTMVPPLGTVGDVALAASGI